MQTLTIKGIEDVINKCSQSDDSLSLAVTALAEIYGYMIFQKVEKIDFADLVKKGTFDKRHSDAVEMFYNA